MRHKFLVTILSGFVSGVFVSSFVDFGWALGLVFGIIHYRRSMSIVPAGSVFLTIALFFAVFGLGQLRYQQADLSGQQSDLQNKIGQRMSLVGIVSDEPEQKENYNKLVLEDEKRESKILVYLPSYPQYKYGDKLKISGILKRPEKFGDNFDWPAYLAKDDIYYEMFYPQTEFISAGNGFWLKEKLFALKAKFLLAVANVRS